MIEPEIPKNEKERLAALKYLDILDTLPEETYDNIVLLASTICDVPISLISLIDADRQWFKAAKGMDAVELPRKLSFCAHAIDSDKPLFEIENALEDERFTDNPYVTSEEGVRFYAGATIRDNTGLVYGTVCVIDSKPRKLTPVQQQALIALSNQVLELFNLRKETNKKNAAEKELNSLLDNLSQIVYELDGEGLCTYANQAMVEQMKCAHADLIGKPVWKYVHEDDLVKMQKFYVKQFKSFSPSCTYEYRVRNKKGEVIWLHHETTMSYEGGRMVKLRTIAKDISETKKLEVERDEQASLYQLLSENTADIISLHELDGTYKFISRAIGETTGYEPEELIGKSPLDFIHEDDHGKISAAIEDVKNGKPTNGLRFRWKSWFGNLIWMEIFTSAVRDEEGIITSFQSTTRDVTRKYIEELQLISYKEGLTMLNVLASISERKDVLLPIAIKELSIYFNLSYAVIKPLSERKPTYSYSRIKGENPLEELFKDPNNDPIPDGEIQVFGEDSPGEFKSFLVAPIYVDANQHSQLILASKDPMEERFSSFVYEYLRIFANWISYVFETANNYEELKLAKDKAEDAALEKEQFLSTMSHEIRTPLNGIIGSTHLLSLHNKDESLVERLKVLQFSSDNLLSLVNDILDFNKISSGNLELEHISFNLRSLLKSIHSNYNSQAEEKGLKFTFDIDDKLSAAYIGDPVRMSQIINNLLGNALKFTKKGEVSLSVKILNESSKTQQLEFVIEDTGIGISPDKKDLIFDVFKQADTFTTREYGGSGLGLSITKNLLSLMGSNIEVTSTLDLGSSFKFVLELEASSQKPSAKNVEFEALSLDVEVLLVEDNAVNRMIAREFLKNWGCTIIEAENGLKAMEILKSKTVDLVLLDLQMPVMDGYETIIHIRELENENQHVPVLALTAETMGDVANKVKGIGMNGLVAKPFHPKDLYSKIVDAIDKVEV